MTADPESPKIGRTGEGSSTRLVENTGCRVMVSRPLCQILKYRKKETIPWQHMRKAECADTSELIWPWVEEPGSPEMCPQWSQGVVLSSLPRHLASWLRCPHATAEHLGHAQGVAFNCSFLPLGGRRPAAAVPAQAAGSCPRTRETWRECPGPGFSLAQLQLCRPLRSEQVDGEKSAHILHPTLPRLPPSLTPTNL